MSQSNIGSSPKIFIFLMLWLLLVLLYRTQVPTTTRQWL
ncbi:hypothetical protein CKA32_000115 [Geitlerinema sp. FC II]|nr:hypothetical protein CKA32_000115 [Geitlerinema sp. FC II]